jgi:dihydrofolate synthase/folylpolyglutamate synthase
LVEALNEAERVNNGAPITQFEITTAAAFLLFARVPADVLILEVGLGGRLDATNVIARPLATVITPVSVDHTKFLGDTLEVIAIEKAGILKRGVPAIIAPQQDSVRDVIAACAARVGAGPLHIAMQDWQAREERGRLVFEDGDGLLDLPPPRLPGRHQYENAGAAIATLRALPQFSVMPAHYEEGVQSAEWPARLQRITKGPLLDLLPPESELWLDGGHNPEGARVVASEMGALEERVPRPLVLVSGILNTKDSDGFFEPFGGLAAFVHTVPITSSDAGLTPDEVAASAAHAGLPAHAYDSLEQALSAIRHDDDLAPRVLICGSLYLAGEVLAKNGVAPA